MNTTVDLSSLPQAELLEEVDYEKILESLKDDLHSINPDFNPNLVFESDTLAKLLEVFAYREYYFRHKVNQSLKNVLLATAYETGLDKLLASIGVWREEHEDDSLLRERALNVFNEYGTAGSIESYRHFALSLNTQQKQWVEDVAVRHHEEHSAVVDVKVLAASDNGQQAISTDTQQTLTLVADVLNGETVRPITDKVTVARVGFERYKLAAELEVDPGIGFREVKENVLREVRQLLESSKTIGKAMYRAKLLSVLAQPGVFNVVLSEPKDDVLVRWDQLAVCDNYDNIDKTIKVSAYQSTGRLPGSVARSVSFNDEDSIKGRLSGTLSVVADKEASDVEAYCVYWGQSASEKLLAQAIVTLPVSEANSGSDNHLVLQHRFSPDTIVPFGATHLLVFSANQYGEMLDAVSCNIVDRALPAVNASAILLSNVSISEGRFTADVRIELPEDQQDIDSYHLWWGSSETDRLEKIETFSKYSALETYLTDKPDNALYLLVYSENANGESPLPTAQAVFDGSPPALRPQSIYLDNYQQPRFQQGLPTPSFQFVATLVLEAATDQADISHYNIYWGSSAYQKLATDADNTSANKLLSLSSDSSLTHSFKVPVTVPIGATHLLAFSANRVGESAQCISTTIEQEFR